MTSHLPRVSCSSQMVWSRFALNACNNILLSWIFQHSSLCQKLPYWTFLMVSFTSISAPKLPLMDEEQATPLGHLPAPRFSQLHLRTGLILSSHETSCIEPFWTLNSETLKNFRARAESWTIRSCSCQWRNSWVISLGVWVYHTEYTGAECTNGQGRGEPNLSLGMVGIGLGLLEKSVDLLILVWRLEVLRVKWLGLTLHPLWSS